MVLRAPRASQVFGVGTAPRRALCALAQVKHGGERLARRPKIEWNSRRGFAWFAALAVRKASPTVQRLIREAGLEGEELTASGPKGTVTPADVESAAVRAAEKSAAASVPFEIEIPAATPYLLDGVEMPTVATTSRAVRRPREPTSFLPLSRRLQPYCSGPAPRAQATSSHVCRRAAARLASVHMHIHI